MTVASRYRELYGDDAELMLAVDLATGDPATLKAGYSPLNAALSAIEHMTGTGAQLDTAEALAERVEGVLDRRAGRTPHPYGGTE